MVDGVAGLKERFVDYLFELQRGKIPETLKPMVIRVEDNTVYLKGATGIRTAVILKQPPRENMATLGFALFGMFWPEILRDVDKLIKKRKKKLLEEEVT